MHKIAKSKKMKHRKSRGFAIVLSLALISFVFLLVITLVSQVRQDMAYSDARENRILAKANARMGMMIAIGEIQKHLGPDMRISATADIYDERIEGSEQADLYEDVATNELPDGQRMWTGVWKNRGVGSLKNLKDQRSTNPLPFNGDDAIALTDSWEYDASYDHHPAIEMSWLVSGNEGSKLGIIQPLSGKVVEHIEVPDGRPVTDEQTRILPVNAGYEYGKKDNAWRDHRNLVETKLTNYYHPLLPLPDPDENETMAWVLKRPFGEDEDLINKNGVKVPKTPLFLKGQQDWDQRQGAYAYWVGDEGVKAKIDFNQSFPLTDQSKILAAPSPNLGDGSFELTAIEADRKKLLLPANLPILGENEEEQENWNEFLANHYHSITTHSFGVLSDLRTGGLKRDLSLGFAQFAPGESKSLAIQNDFDDNFIFRERIIYKKNVPLFEDAKYVNVWKLGSESVIEDDDTLLAGPRWSVLADFHNLYRTMPSTLEMTIPDQFPRIIGDNSVIFEGLPESPGRVFNRTNISNYYFNSWDDSKRAHRPEPKNHPLLPVMTKLRLGVCPVMKPNSNKVALAVLPSVSLWNPYDKPLKINNLFIEIPPSYDQNNGYTHSIGFSMYTQDLKQFDLFRKWWMALYEREQVPFRNEMWNDFQQYLEFDPNLVSIDFPSGLRPTENRYHYPAINYGLVKNNALIKLQPRHLYGSNDPKGLSTSSSTVAHAIENYIRQKNEFTVKGWKEGKPLSSLISKNIYYNSSDNSLRYRHENSDVTEDDALIADNNFIPEFAFFGLKNIVWKTVKDIRLKIMHSNYMDTIETIGPGEVITFGTFTEHDDSLLEANFNGTVNRLVIPVVRETVFTSERGFLLQTDEVASTGVARLSVQLTGFNTMASSAVEALNYNRRSKSFTYGEVPSSFSRVRCLTMFSGDADKDYNPNSADSPKVISRYANWAAGGATNNLETNVMYLRENYDTLGTGDPVNKENQPGWGWEVAVKFAADDKNTQILLNDYNVRSIVHSNQHGLKKWVESSKPYSPENLPFTKSYAQPVQTITTEVDSGEFSQSKTMVQIAGTTFKGKDFLFVDPRTPQKYQFGGEKKALSESGKYGDYEGSEYVPHFYKLDDFNYDSNDLSSLGREWHNSWNDPDLSTDQRAIKMGLGIENLVPDDDQSGIFDPAINPSLNELHLRPPSKFTESVGFFSHKFDDKNQHNEGPYKDTGSPYNGHFTDYSTAAVLFQTPENKPLSLFEYRHSNLNNYLHGPNYAFGSSYASLSVARHRTWSRINHVIEEPINDYGMGSLQTNLDKKWEAKEYFKNLFQSLFPNSWETRMEKALKEMKGTAFSDEPHDAEEAEMIDWSNIDPREGYGAWRSAGETSSHQNVSYDHSFYLNRALLDGYFLSGSTDLNDSRRMELLSLGDRLYPFVWNKGSGTPSPYNLHDQAFGNTRLMAYLRNGEWNSTSYGSLQKNLTNSSQNDTSLRYQTVAGDLLVEGAFNINSTSVDAWIAHLSSLRGIQLENGNVSLNETPVIRFTAEPTANNWNELRKLSDEEIRKLAEAIVRQVKLRGPFLSFADFVNRRLCPGPRKRGSDSVLNFTKLNISEWIEEHRDNSLPGLRGAVQEAIAQSGINDPKESDRSPSWPINEDEPIPKVSAGRWDTQSGKLYDSSFGLIGLSKQKFITPLDANLVGEHEVNRAQNNFSLGQKKENKYWRFPSGGRVEQVKNDRLVYPGAGVADAKENILAVESTATGACKPGWVLQSDILAPLAPSMTARSDTFVIRVMGETNQKNAAKTWIEVVVQRTPDYVKPDLDAPHHRPHEPFMDQNLNGYWDEATDEPWTNLNYNQIEYPDLPGDKNSNYRDGMPSDLSLVLDGQEEDVNSLKGISIFGVNQRFGRKFRIVQFRWLREQDV